jgi:hypothetical protein
MADFEDLRGVDGRSYSSGHCFPFVFSGRAFACIATVPSLIFKALQSVEWTYPFFQVEAMPSWQGQVSTEEEVSLEPATAKEEHFIQLIECGKKSGVRRLLA